MPEPGPFMVGSSPPPPAQRVKLLSTPRQMSFLWLCACGRNGRPPPTAADAVTAWEDHRAIWHAGLLRAAVPMRRPGELFPGLGAMALTVPGVPGDGGLVGLMQFALLHRANASAPRSAATATIMPSRRDGT